MTPRLGRITLVLAALLAPVGCGSETQQAKPDPSASAASTPEDSLLGGKLAKLGKNAPSSAAVDADQPPANGVFAPGLADKAHKKGAAPVIKMFDEGAEPRLSLFASPPDREKLTVTVLLSSQGNPQIPLVFGLSILPPGETPPDEAAKPAPSKKGPTSPAATAKSAPSADVAATSAPKIDLPPDADRRLVAHVTSIGVAGVEADELPKKMLETIQALKGATVSFTVTKTGVTGFSHAAAPDAAERTSDLHLGALEEALSGLYTAAPDKPVGEGAYWMVTDRRTSFGSDVVRYRVYKVQKVEGDSAVISIDVRQYSADEARPSIVAVDGDQQNVVLGKYQGGGRGGLEAAPKSRWPAGGAIQLKVAAEIVPGDQKDNPQAPRGAISFELAAQVGELEVGAAPPGAPPGRPGAPPPGAPAPPPTGKRQP